MKRILEPVTLGALAALLAGCGPTAPRDAVSALEVGPCALSGAWGWAGNFNPGGSYLNLSLRVDGTAISGAGASAGIGPFATVDSIAVIGRVLGTFAAPSGFSMALVYRGSGVTQYVGSAICPDTLSGTATPSDGQPYPLVLIRGRTVN